MKSFLMLTSAQANGMIVLLPLLACLILSEPLWRWWASRRPDIDARDIAMLDSLLTAFHAAGKTQVPPAPERELFRFDPNTATRGELEKLGFDHQLAQRIENYRNKGGRFHKKTDLLKLYGMDTARYMVLAPYILLPPATVRTGRPASRPKEGARLARASAARPVARFDLNLADTAQLERIYGIGQKLSRRIIKYRSSLGGFVDTGQLGEVFGLDSAVLARLAATTFVAPDFLPHRINLNTADEKILDAHPYLNRQEARAIVAYRFQHGQFNAVSDLGKLPMFDEEKLRRLELYLKTEE